MLRGGSKISSIAIYSCHQGVGSQSPISRKTLARSWSGEWLPFHLRQTTKLAQDLQLQFLRHPGKFGCAGGIEDNLERTQAGAGL